MESSSVQEGGMPAGNRYRGTVGTKRVQFGGGLGEEAAGKSLLPYTRQAHTFGQESARTRVL